METASQASSTISLEVQRQCEGTVLNFMAHFDNGKFEEMEKYFAADGIWVRADGIINGASALSSLRDKRPAGILVRHVISNLLASRIDERTLRVKSYVMVYRTIRSSRQNSAAEFSGPHLV